MTKEEYEKICKIIDENTHADWNQYYSARPIIPPQGIERMKRQIARMVTKEPGNEQQQTIRLFY